MYFVGTFDYAMDERGRLPLPPRYRDAFRDGIVLSQGSPDRCVRISTEFEFDRHASDYTAESPVHRKGRTLRRVLFARTHKAELDKQNRVLVPASLREYAGLTGKVLVVGAGEYLEVWAPDEYEAEMSLVDAQLESTLESIETRQR
ncbi:MAG: cell division/cell wall cluster transcriptional repressor MraZ [Chloroflexota bacterium]|nr:cell division/cell wall cluster transcriptional repressor MraZ [Chloroflexota bacterium]